MLTLKNKLGLSEEYLKDIINRSKSVEVSEEESKIINKWAKQDVCLDMLINWKGKSYSQRLERMIHRKTDDYKLFVILYEDNNLKSNVLNYMRYSPCGKAKIRALEYRFENKIL